MLVDINLLPEKERERSTLLIAALAILGAAILFWAVLFIISNVLAKDTGKLDNQYKNLMGEQEEVRSQLPAPGFVDEKIQLASTVEWAEDFQFNTAPLLKDLVEALPQRGFFSEFEFTAPNLATVKVQFDTKPEAAHYYARMVSSPYISNVVFESVVMEDVTDEKLTPPPPYVPRYLATYKLEFVDDRTVEAVAGTEDQAPDNVGNLEEGGATDD